MNKTFSILGTGKIGTALTALLLEKGWDLCYAYDQSEKHLNDFLNKFSPEKNRNKPSDCLFICIKDDNFSVCFNDLMKGVYPISNHLIHTSGFHKAAFFQAVKDKYSIGIHSFHPMISVINTDPSEGSALLKKAWWALSGDDAGWMDAFMSELELSHFILDDEKKDFYHAAAVMTANLIIGVLRAAEKTASVAGIHPDEYEKIYLPLVDSVIEHVHQEGLHHALGGPIVRRDFKLLNREKEILKIAGLSSEHDIYSLLSDYLIHLTENKI
jgi:predicted short-subunit dehydrogenase-like oxidoreductase (DUF2520 family)